MRYGDVAAGRERVEQPGDEPGRVSSSETKCKMDRSKSAVGWLKSIRLRSAGSARISSGSFLDARCS